MTTETTHLDPANELLAEHGLRIEADGSVGNQFEWYPTVAAFVDHALRAEVNAGLAFDAADAAVERAYEAQRVANARHAKACDLVRIAQAIRDGEI